jgi:hypothetical protein
MENGRVWREIRRREYYLKPGERLVGPSGVRQFMCYVPESMRAQLLARRREQDAALTSDPTTPPSPPTSGPAAT